MLNRLAFSTILPCVQHQNASHLAPKRTAFSTKMHCVLRYIAPHLVSKSPKIWCKWPLFDINIHLTAFTGYPLFALKQTSARIDFLRLVGLLVNYKPLIMLKFMLKSRQKVELKCSQVKPKSVVGPLIYYFQFVSIASCSSFVCLSASCLSYSLDVARYAFKNKTGSMLNNTQNLHRL